MFISRFVQARPGDFLKVLAQRILPPAPDGGINPKLFGLREELKLQPSQHARLLAAWEQYKDFSAEARSIGRLALHQAVASLGGDEDLSMSSIRAANVSSL